MWTATLLFGCDSVVNDTVQTINFIFSDYSFKKKNKNKTKKEEKMEKKFSAIVAISLTLANKSNMKQIHIEFPKTKIKFFKSYNEEKILQKKKQDFEMIIFF